MEKLEIPAELRTMYRQDFLKSIRRESGVNHDEIKLFDWFVQETDEMIDSMLSVENVFIKEQMDAGREDIDDGGMVPVEYFAKRMRYSHVIFLTSLFETYLDRACAMLTSVISEVNMPFSLAELSGDKWTKRRRFLERYGCFEIDQGKWNVAKDLMDIRNVLVHENGSTSGITKDRKKDLGQLVGLRFDGYEVTIEPEFIKTVSSELKLLIDGIQSEIRKVASRAIKPKCVD